MSSILLARPTMSSRSSGGTKVSFRCRTISWLSLSPWCSIAWISRTLFSTSVKSPRSFASASAASTAFWACCSKRTKNSLFLGKSDRRMGSSLVCRALSCPTDVPGIARRGWGSDSAIQLGARSTSHKRRPAGLSRPMLSTPPRRLAEQATEGWGSASVGLAHRHRSRSRRQGSERRGMRFAQAPARRVAFGGVRKRKHDGALRDRTHGGYRARDDHRRLPRDRCVRPRLQRGARAPKGVAYRARRTDGCRDAGTRLGSQGELALPNQVERGRRRAALSSIWAPLRPEELPFQVFNRPLQGVDNPGNPGGDDLDAPIPRDAQLVPGLHSCLHRRAVRRDREDDAALFFHDRPDPELSFGHGFDHCLDLLVAPKIGLRLGRDPADGLP